MNQKIIHGISVSMTCFLLINSNYAWAEENDSEAEKTLGKNLATPWLQQALDELTGIPNAPKNKIASKRVTLSYIDHIRATQLRRD